MSLIIDFQPSAELSLAFARNCWSVWYSAIFTEPDGGGGSVVVRRPVQELVLAVAPFAVRHLFPPKPERVQAVVASRFRDWLIGFSALLDESIRLEGITGCVSLVALCESRDAFDEDVYGDLVNHWGYSERDGSRIACRQLFGRLCREFVDWIGEKPKQVVLFWLDGSRSIAIERLPDGRVILAFRPGEDYVVDG